MLDFMIGIMHPVATLFQLSSDVFYVHLHTFSSFLRVEPDASEQQRAQMVCIVDTIIL